MALSGLADQPACGSRAPEARASLAGELPSPRAGVGPHSAAAQSFADSALVQACEFCVRLAGTTAFPFRCAPRARRRGDAPHKLGRFGGLSRDFLRQLWGNEAAQMCECDNASEHFQHHSVLLSSIRSLSSTWLKLQVNFGKVKLEKRPTDSVTTSLRRLNIELNEQQHIQSKGSASHDKDRQRRGGPGKGGRPSRCRAGESYVRRARAQSISTQFKSQRGGRETRGQNLASVRSFANRWMDLRSRWRVCAHFPLSTPFCDECGLLKAKWRGQG